MARVEDAAQGVVIGPPDRGDAAALGNVHLQSWLETYVNPDLGVTEDWFHAHRGFLDSPAGTTWREKLIAATVQNHSPAGPNY